MHVAALYLEPAASYDIAIDFDLSTWDSYNAETVFGTGYWDSFSVNITTIPYPQAVTADPIATELGSSLGFVWGGDDYSDSTLATDSGSDSITLDGDPDG